MSLEKEKMLALGLSVFKDIVKSTPELVNLKDGFYFHDVWFDGCFGDINCLHVKNGKVRSLIFTNSRKEEWIKCFMTRTREQDDDVFYTDSSTIARRVTKEELNEYHDIEFCINCVKSERFEFCDDFMWKCERCGAEEYPDEVIAVGSKYLGGITHVNSNYVCSTCYSELTCGYCGEVVNDYFVWFDDYKHGISYDCCEFCASRDIFETDFKITYLDKDYDEPAQLRKQLMKPWIYRPCKIGMRKVEKDVPKE